LGGQFSHGNVSLVPFQFVRVNCRNPIVESLGQVFSSPRRFHTSFKVGRVRTA
jgi:hypothetical protein